MLTKELLAIDIVLIVTALLPVLFLFLGIKKFGKKTDKRQSFIEFKNIETSLLLITIIVVSIFNMNRAQNIGFLITALIVIILTSYITWNNDD